MSTFEIVGQPDIHIERRNGELFTVITIAHLDRVT